MAEEPCSFFAPTASGFNAKNDQAAATWLDKFWARPFFGPSRIPERRASVLSSALWGFAFNTSVVVAVDGGDVEI